MTYRTADHWKALAVGTVRSTPGNVCALCGGRALGWIELCPDCVRADSDAAFGGFFRTRRGAVWATALQAGLVRTRLQRVMQMYAVRA